MRHRLKTSSGQALYKLRQSRHSGIEPVFGIIQSAMGFRQFLLRGLEKVSTEWSLVSLACNLRRPAFTLRASARLRMVDGSCRSFSEGWLHTLKAAARPAAAA